MRNVFTADKSRKNIRNGPGEKERQLDQVAIEAEARQFIELVHERRRRSCRVWAWVVLVSFVMQIVGWWSYFVFVSDSPTSFVPGKVLTSLLLPGFYLMGSFALLQCILELRSVRKDREAGLSHAEGKFFKGMLHSGWADLCSVKVGKVVVHVPRPAFDKMPKDGTGGFTYFPHTRLCWTFNGQVVWRRGDYRWY